MIVTKTHNQFDVFLVNLDPTQGSEIKKTRPCVIVSPNEMNHALLTIIAAPMTTMIRDYPTRVSLTFADKAGQIALDQIRALDKKRLVKKIGEISPKEQQNILAVLQMMFA